MTFNIAVLEPNGKEIDSPDMLKDTVDIIKTEIENLKSNINKYVKIVSVSCTQEMMEKTVDIIELRPSMMGITTTCYENEDYIYQLIHTHYQHSRNKQINSIASSLAYDKIRINGRVVVIKSIMKENGEFVPSNITVDDINDLLDIRTYSKGIFIRYDENIEERTFIVDPVECCYDFRNGEEEKKLQTYCFRIANFPVIMIYDTCAEHLNKIGSELSGIDVNGNVFLFIKNGDNDHIHFNKLLFDKIKIIMDKGKLDKLKTKMDCRYMTEQYRKIMELL